MLGERQVELVERRLELVEIEVLELERGREHDAPVVEPVARVDERLRVQLEEAPEEREVAVAAHVPDVDAQHDERRVDAERDGRPQWAAQRDDRITKVGHLIRKTRMDELPQILNVLKGDMSFIGPRPERPYFVDELITQIPYYGERHRVRPGISGWAQINYPYGASVEDARAKLTYDLYYIKNYSIFLDMIILIETIRVVLWPRGVR